MDALRAKVDGDLPESVMEYDRALRAVRTDRWKYIEGSDGSQELYDLSVDPAENRDIVEAESTVAERLGELLQSEHGTLTPAAGTTKADVDRLTEKRLEDLGYLQ